MEGNKALLRGLAFSLACLTTLWLIWGSRFAFGVPDALAPTLKAAGGLWVAALFALAWRQGKGRWWALSGVLVLALPLLTALLLSIIIFDLQVTLAAVVVADGWTWLLLLPPLLGGWLVWRGTNF